MVENYMSYKLLQSLYTTTFLNTKKCSCFAARELFDFETYLFLVCQCGRKYSHGK